MRCTIVALSAVVMVLVMMSGPVPCQAQWELVVPAAIAQIRSLFKDDDRMEFMGHTCSYSQSARGCFVPYFEGKFSCPSWTQIQGSAMTRSRSRVKTKTIENFLSQAKDNGLVTEETVKTWLKE